jgi:dTMP kinase
MKRGKFIVIDGGEGAGKSTLLKFLKDEVLAGQKVIFSREPGGTPVSEIIRSTVLSPDLKNSTAKTQLLLFWAARAQHVDELIEPTLKKGVHVIVDRFDSSSYAYQLYAQGHMNLKDLFFELRKKVLGKTVPNLYVFLEVSPEVGLARVALRSKETSEKKNHFDDKHVDFHRKLTGGFKKFLKDHRHAIINAEQPLEKVKTDLKKVILGELGESA